MGSQFSQGLFNFLHPLARRRGNPWGSIDLRKYDRQIPSWWGSIIFNNCPCPPANYSPIQSLRTRISDPSPSYSWFVLVEEQLILVPTQDSQRIE
ncbi:MAG: hypothetical protein RBG13Loki_0266 [Promethearchaeota archaeon CR_4]|nr:MAG: hypothetical protein RBG13Loki_0266 [Candidatus Lokiarchaeota archaeon CR_4]